MKKILLLAFAASLNMALAQTNTATPSGSDLQTPSSVNSRYSTDYPNTTPAWSMDGSDYRADYNDGTNHSVVYDKSGNRLSTDNEMREGAYPAGINDYYKTNYPSETYTVWSSQDKSGETSYYVKRKTEKVWFDKNGKYKSKTKIKTDKVK